MKVELFDSVKNVVDYIITSENYTSPQIDVLQGSEVGDGYLSKTYAISIKSENGKSVELFAKYLPEMVNNKLRNIFVKVFQTEFRFYTEIYPAFSTFQEEKGIEKPFNNVPKHYGMTNTNNMNKCETPPIVLENLKSLGYMLRDRKLPIDDHHLKLPIQALARYHALSYAMKDQEPKLFQKLTTGIVDVVIENFEEIEMDILTKCIDQFLNSLDPAADSKCLNRCKNLSKILLEHTLNIPHNVDKYAVIGQGDCWSNNMMFLYEDNTGLPIDVKLIDWQCQRVNSPVLDFVYFFYSSATKEMLDNADFYLNLYYATLTQRIKELGSDPEKIYPYEIFLKHWRMFALFGLSTAFSILKAQLFEKDEIPNLLNSTEPSLDGFSAVLKHQDKYNRQIKDVVEHFIDKGLL